MNWRDRLWRTLFFALILVAWVLLSGTVGAHADDGKPTKWFFPLMLGFPPPPAQDGIGMTGGTCDDLRKLGAVWYQNWGPQPPNCGEDMRALALIWNWRFTDPAPKTLDELKYRDPLTLGPVPFIPPHVAGVGLTNEPNLWQQANMRVLELVGLQLRVEATREYESLDLHSMATFRDLQIMVDTIEGFRYVTGRLPRWEGLSAHCYYDSAQACIDYLTEMRALAVKYWPGVPPPIYVTEWAVLPCAKTTTNLPGAGSIEAAIREADKLVRWMEGQDWIAAHLWFSSTIADYERQWWTFKPIACDTSLWRDGELTDFGQWFAKHSHEAH